MPQAVFFKELRGESAKKGIKARMLRKVDADEKVFAEIGFFPSDYPSWGLSKINFHKNLWGYPCIIMARGATDNLVCPVILEIMGGKIKGVYMCAVPPMRDAFRTGEYPV